MAFDVGKLRSRVDVQRRALVVDGLGGQSETWAALKTGVWVEIKALTGRELEAAQAVRATDSHQITLRNLPGLTAADRMIYTDPQLVTHIYNITYVIDMDMRHRYMECTAVEGLASG